MHLWAVHQAFDGLMMITISNACLIRTTGNLRIKIKHNILDH